MAVFRVRRRRYCLRGGVLCLRAGKFLMESYYDTVILRKSSAMLAVKTRTKFVSILNSMVMRSRSLIIENIFSLKYIDMAKFSRGP